MKLVKAELILLAIGVLCLFAGLVMFVDAILGPLE
jgi:hypothetical protein